VKYLDALAKVEHHASTRNSLLILGLERFQHVGPGKSVFQMLHVNVARTVLSGERAPRHCVLDDEHYAKFAADANQLIVELGKLGSVLKLFIFGPVDLIDGH
jgi:hypothetical protein